MKNHRNITDDWRKLNSDDQFCCQNKYFLTGPLKRRGALKYFLLLSPFRRVCAIILVLYQSAGVDKRVRSMSSYHSRQCGIVLKPALRLHRLHRSIVCYRLWRMTAAESCENSAICELRVWFDNYYCMLFNSRLHVYICSVFYLFLNLFL